MKFAKMAIIALVLLVALLVGIAAGAEGNDSSIPATMAPGYFDVETCDESGSMPIIYWGGKGVSKTYEMKPVGPCRLGFPWEIMSGGHYCTGIGSLDGEEFIPDKCTFVGSRIFLPHIIKQGD